MTRRQLQKRARLIIRHHLAQCGLKWRCTRIIVKPGLRSKEHGELWARVKTTPPATFVLHLDAELLRGEGPALEALIGHEVAHIALDWCQLDYEAEERICDLIGHILAHCD